MAVELELLTSSSKNNIDTNFERVEEALQDVVSRSGTLPNSMNADLDMNGNDILNIQTLQVDDITVDGSNVTGVLERAETAADEAQAALAEVEELYDQIIDEVVYNPVAIEFTTSGAGPYDMGVEIGSTNNIDIIIGGIPQHHNTYTIAGTTFTFTVAPANGLPMEAAVKADIRLVNAPSDGSVITSSIVDGSVTATKIGDFAVTGNKIGNLAVNTSKISDEAVTLPKIAAAAINSIAASAVDVVEEAGYLKGLGNDLPAICLTFDYYNTAMTTAKPIMDTYNLVGTFFPALSTIDQVGGPTQAELNFAKYSGWEIGAYSETNWVTAYATDRNALVTTINNIKQGFQDIGLPVTSLAPNQRSWSGVLRNIVEDQFERVRVVDNFFTDDGYFQALPVPDRLWIADGGTNSLSIADTGASLSAQVDQLIALGGLWTVVIHNVADSGDGNFRIPVADFNTFCNKIDNERTAGNLRVIRFRDI